jgi:Domain of unknown function (DUF2017)
VKVNRRRGVVRLRLEPVERSVLTSLFDDLAISLGDDELDLDDPVRRRLYPDGYDDHEAAAEFRTLTESALTHERTDRIMRCTADLALDDDLSLDDEAGERWIQVLNDLRLVLGTRLEITEDDDLAVVEDEPSDPRLAIYQWLTVVQDSLVRALTK